MVSSPGDQSEAQTMESGSSVASSGAAAKSQADLLAQMDTELMFRLIDSILPFEACLYHQVLPLALEGSRLRLGMVNLDDSAALDYVRRILAYMNCSLVPQTLSSDIHHAVLTAYLNYSGSQKKSQAPPSSSHSVAKRIERKLAQEAARVSQTPKPENKPKADKSDRNSHPTLLVDSPEELGLPEPGRPGSKAAAEETVVAGPNGNSENTTETVVTPNGVAAGANSPPIGAATPDSSTFILKSDFQAGVVNSDPGALPGNNLLVLELHPQHLAASFEALVTLPAPELVQELLGRVLAGDGIGRLYFERQQTHGRILWSQNGVPQAVLEDLPLETVQGVIDELKILTHLPLIPVEKPKQVEIERLYQRQRLLLRLRVMPLANGEEATLQVLRGAALKFYQQQQLTSLSRDALSIAQNLQQKVDEIRARTRFYPLVTNDQMNILPALNNLLKSVEQQLNELKALQIAETDEDQ